MMQVSHFYPFLNQEYGQGNFMWSWKYGLGGDIFSEFLYYFSTSPFFWLTMPLDLANIHDVYQVRMFTSIFKIAVAMIFMYHYLRYLKRTQLSSIVGSLIYGGSIYLVFNSLRFDFMADGMVWLPLLILGFERMIDHKKKGLFVAMVFLIVCSNFYLAFISTVFLYLYAGLKYFLIRDKFQFVDFIKYYLRITLWYIVGVLLSLFALLPAIGAYLKVDRFYYDLHIPLFFEKSFYKEFFFNLFLVPKKVDFVLVLPIMIFLLTLYGFFIKEKQMRQRMIFATFIFVLTMFPITYSFFNGLSSIQFRWTYLFIFVLAQIIPYILDHLMLEQPHRKMKQYFIVVSVLLVVMVMLRPMIVKLKPPSTGYLKQDIMIGALGLLTVGCFFLIHKLPRKVIATSLVGLLTLNILLTNWVLIHEYLGSPRTVKERQHKFLKLYDQPEDVAMFRDLEKEDPTFFRTMWEGIPEFNAPLVYGYRGFSTYNSLISGTVHRFFKNDYNILQYNTPSLYMNLDNRIYPETVLANKYYVIPKDRSWERKTFGGPHTYLRGDLSWKPYGYTLMKETTKFKVYRNDNALPIGFLYDSIVDRQTFDGLNYAQKDQLLLHAAVVDKDDRSKANLPVFQTDQLKVQNHVVNKQDIKLKNATLTGDFLVAGEDAELIIPNPFAQKLGETLLEVEVKRKDNKGFSLEIMQKDPKAPGLEVTEKKFKRYDEDNTYNYPRKKIVFNTGYNPATDYITVKIPDAGSYKLRELSLQFNSLEGFQELVKQKKEQSLQNVSFTSNQVKGEIKAAKDGILYLAIPYSKGWKATIDGKRVDPIKVNATFTGLPITKGDHKIELSYFTPYLLEGAGISFVTLLSLLGYFWWERRKKRNSAV
ncbi:putative membrane protein YfhO [Croceifilum oryzae]|uniref:Membrane protein YfhO n=1 Tax=Croceifilum oryzae TaxID=1553429 RepID=A0AAJ1WR80_9BACL|nr:putative membrane protein YfhO [Croceifilum oryzae]